MKCRIDLEVHFCACYRSIYHLLVQFIPIYSHSSLLLVYFKRKDYMVFSYAYKCDTSNKNLYTFVPHFLCFSFYFRYILKLTREQLKRRQRKNKLKNYNFSNKEKAFLSLIYFDMCDSFLFLSKCIHVIIRATF